MILTVPVLYQADVKRPGRRGGETVLLAAEASIRIPSPPGFGVAIRVSRSFLDAFRSIHCPTSGVNGMRIEHGTLEWASDAPGSTKLFAPLRFHVASPSGHPGDAREPSEPITGAMLEAVGQEVVVSGRHRGLFFGTVGWPFQSRESIGPYPGGLPVVRETETFRSVVPHVEDGRNIALAHASRMAAALRSTPDGGVWCGDDGPALGVRGNRVHLHVPSVSRMVRSDVRAMMDHTLLFPLDRLDEVRRWISLTCPPEYATPLIDGFSSEVLRPTSLAWSSLPMRAIRVAHTMMAPDSSWQIPALQRHLPRPLAPGIAEEVLALLRLHASIGTWIGHEPPSERRDEVLALSRALLAAGTAFMERALPLIPAPRVAARTVENLAVARSLLTEMENDPSPVWRPCALDATVRGMIESRSQERRP